MQNQNAELRTNHQELYAWFNKFGRDLPWRRTSDPYAILVSEYMLQQTQVETAREYFLRWMKRFPNLQMLAAASEDEVMAMWQGLGYYARARNLQRAAQALLHLPIFPELPEQLIQLPGIGEYTAHAVAAFAFNRCVPVVDANIARVLARVFNYSQPIDVPEGMRFLREQATALLPAQGGGRLHTSALMELGALVCKPRQPLCGACPLHSQCLTENPETLPIKRPRAAIKRAIENRAFICDGESIFLSRATGKWWKGMWILPELEKVPQRSCDYSIKFSVTRHRVTMQIWKVPAFQNLTLRNFAFKELSTIAMPAPHRRGVAALLAISHTNL